MPLLRYLQHWLTGRGPRLQVADFVPETHPIRQWADTFPWGALVAAADRWFAQRFPKSTARGRPPVSTRVLLALELLKHELACSDEQICSRLRTDLAVMYACGIREVRVDGSQEHFVLPEGLAQFRRRLDEPLMAEWLAIQAGTAMEDGEPFAFAGQTLSGGMVKAVKVRNGVVQASLEGPDNPFLKKPEKVTRTIATTIDVDMP